MDLRAEELRALKAIYNDTLFLDDETILADDTTIAHDTVPTHDPGSTHPSSTHDPGSIHQTPPSDGTTSSLNTSSPLECNYNGVITVPISLDDPITVSDIARSHVLHHLPPLRLAFLLPSLYPYEQCPDISLHSSFLPKETKTQVENELRQLWYDSKYQVLFAMVSHLQELVALPMDLLKKGQLTEFFESSDSLKPRPLPLPSGNPIFLSQGATRVCLGLDQQLIDLLVTSDKDQAHRVFESLTFVCGICQENAFGLRSFQFPQCKHVFCLRCLRDFFINLIDDANVEKVHCPDFHCSKSVASERESHVAQRIHNDLDFEEFKKKLMTPPILLDDLKRILDHDPSAGSPNPRKKLPTACDNSAKAPRHIYEKYLALFLDHQQNLLSKLFPARVVTCAGIACTNLIYRLDVSDLLVVCRKCGYAFCNNCRKSNHTKTRICTGVRDKRQYFGISEDELEVWSSPKTPENAAQKELLRRTYGLDLLRKLALEYDMDKMDRLFLQLVTDGDFSKCPTCDLVIQRLDGCNKMKCLACYSFFCNVCGAFLPPDTPYEHFNDKSSSCYGKLFHGMPGLDET